MDEKLEKHMDKREIMLTEYYEKLQEEIQAKRQAQKEAGRVWDEATTEYMQMDADARKASQIEDIKLMIEEIKNDSDEED
jgi:hypothetical protein